MKKQVDIDLESSVEIVKGNLEFKVFKYIFKFVNLFVNL